ncbi:hypothetical protein BDQ17DRAFT_1330679 [Cyathus striatus]|nr:hypothetical protein BDQ17DRAFT_1330679 [Cyathus striatus]
MAKEHNELPISHTNTPTAPNLLTLPVVQHSGIDRPELGTGIKITFEDSKGNLTRAVEAGACGGSIACSTCHIILPTHIYDTLPEADDDENDMLDMAFGLTDTSRLGCQLSIVHEILIESDGVEDDLVPTNTSWLGYQVEADDGHGSCPAATRNTLADGTCQLLAVFIVGSMMAKADGLYIPYISTSSEKWKTTYYEIIKRLRLVTPKVQI